MRTALPLKVATASFIGTTIEYYDFQLYGTAAALVFNRLFFPSFDPLVGTLAAFATFAVGFLARPLGGAVFGHFGDRIGRRAMLVLTMLIMGGATALIGVLPTYDQVGLMAPALLVLLRFLQGIGLGGEWGGAVLMAIEHAPSHRRGFFGSWPQMGAPAGIALANAVFGIVAGLQGDSFLSWAWRVPFLLSLVLIAIGLVIRHSVPETPAFQALQGARARQPLLEVVRTYPRQIILTTGASCALVGCVYIVTAFLLTYATQSAGYARQTVLAVVSAAAALQILVMPIAGALTDRIGRRTVFLSGSILATLAAFPFFWLVDSGRPELLFAGGVLVTLGPAIMFGAQSSFFAELFATHVRYSGVSLGYQLSTIFSGLSPLIATALLATYGSSTPIALYMVGLGLISVVSVLALAEPRREHVEGRLATTVPVGVASQEHATS